MGKMGRISRISGALMALLHRGEREKIRGENFKGRKKQDKKHTTKKRKIQKYNLWLNLLS